MKLDHKDIWTGIYRGVPFEISNWGNKDPDHTSYPNNNHWNYYLYLQMDLFKDKSLAKRLIAKKERSEKRYFYQYWGLPVIHDLEMHGGVTYYDIIGEGASKRIKIGCDYNHLYDEPWSEDIRSVSQDCKHSIDLLKQENIMFNRCGFGGKLVNEEDGIYSVELDRFYSRAALNEAKGINVSSWLANLPIDGASLSAKV